MTQIMDGTFFIIRIIWEPNLPRPHLVETRLVGTHLVETLLWRPIFRHPSSGDLCVQEASHKTESSN